ncbi:MAG: hypothetical protein R3B68_08445 [Phycisphaerales bacterium]
MSDAASIPFHVARAYARPVGGTPTLAKGQRTVLPEAAGSGSLRQAPSRTPSLIAARLVAARVPGTIDFSAGNQPQARTGAASMAFYRHPADANAAATSIDAGRVLDTTA